MYVEKLSCHSIWEGRKMVDAARRYNRVVQVGTQNRIAPYNIAAREYITSGNIGKIHLCKAYSMKLGGPFKLPSDMTALAGFDWVAWIGPDLYRDYNSGIFEPGWHKCL